MNISKLQKATKIFDQVKKLDSEILELDRFAMALVNNEITANFSITGEKVKAIKASFDEDGSLVMDQDREESPTGYFLSGLLGRRDWRDRKEDVKPEFEISHRVEEKVLLELLGVLMFNKNRERESLLNELSEIGVKL